MSDDGESCLNSLSWCLSCTHVLTADGPTAIAFGPGGKTVAISAGAGVHFYKTDTGKEVRQQPFYALKYRSSSANAFDMFSDAEHCSSLLCLVRKSSVTQ